MPLSFPLYGRPTGGVAGPISWLIVGLGNPGPKYALTRHNAGFQLLDELARADHIPFNDHQQQALVGRGEIAGTTVLLVKPQTYMNLSGRAVAPLARFYKVPPAQILVVFDDLDLPAATLRLRPKGSGGGHKGMASIIADLGSSDFPRLRLGIGRPAGLLPTEAYVLQAFSPAEAEAMQAVYTAGRQAIHIILEHGLAPAMNQFNR